MKPDPVYAPLPPRLRDSALLHLVVARDGSIHVTALYEPPIDLDGAHVMTDIEAVAARMIRAAIDAGAREV